MSKKIKIKRIINKTRFSFTILVFAFYLVVGFLFLFTDLWSDLIPKARITIGLILIFFGLLRVFIAYYRYKNKNQKIELTNIKKENINAVE